MGDDKDYETMYEKLFREDIQDKKRAGRGAMHNSGRRGGGTKGVKSVKFAVDFMSAKDKRLYLKAGEIMQTNYYDTLKNIPSFEQMQDMEYSKANVIAVKVRENFTNKQMITYWNINNGKLYDKIYYKFGVLEKPHCRDKKNNPFHGKNYKVIDAHEKLIDDVLIEQEPEVKKYPFEHISQFVAVDNGNSFTAVDIEQSEKDAEMEALRDLLKQSQELNAQLTEKLKLDRGLKLSLEGEFKGQEILERMLKYVDNLIGENIYNIELSIIEKI